MPPSYARSAPVDAKQEDSTVAGSAAQGRPDAITQRFQSFKPATVAISVKRASTPGEEGAGDVSSYTVGLTKQSAAKQHLETVVTFRLRTTSGRRHDLKVSVAVAFICVMGLCLAKPNMLSHAQAEGVVGGAPVQCLATACIVSSGFAYWNNEWDNWYGYAYLAASGERVDYSTANSLTATSQDGTKKRLNCPWGTAHCWGGTPHSPATIAYATCPVIPTLDVTRHTCE